MLVLSLFFHFNLYYFIIKLIILLIILILVPNPDPCIVKIPWVEWVGDIALIIGVNVESYE